MQMRRILIGLAVCGLSLAGVAQTRYTLSFKLQGDAISRFLFFFPIRVYYESALSIHLQAVSMDGGGLEFSYVDLASPGYTFRTLGFSGREAVILYADDQEARGWAFVEDKLERWKREAPVYAEKVKRYHRYEYRIKPASWNPLVFRRSTAGVILAHDPFRMQLQPQFLNRHSLTFKPFPMLELLLSFFDHPVAPPQDHPLEDTWECNMVDYSERINQIGAHMEKVVAEMVEVKQKGTACLVYRSRLEEGEILRLEGELKAPVKLWKGFRLVGMRRLLRFQGAAKILIQDELTLDIRNEKGQGGYGTIALKINEQ